MDGLSLSMVLRSRLLAVDNGLSFVAAATICSVTASTPVRWQTQRHWPRDFATELQAATFVPGAGGV